MEEQNIVKGKRTRVPTNLYSAEYVLITKKTTNMKKKPAVRKSTKTIEKKTVKKAKEIATKKGVHIFEVYKHQSKVV